MKDNLMKDRYTVARAQSSKELMKSKLAFETLKNHIVSRCRTSMQTTDIFQTTSSSMAQSNVRHKVMAM